MVVHPIKLILLVDSMPVTFTHPLGTHVSSRSHTTPFDQLILGRSPSHPVLLVSTPEQSTPAD